MSICLEVPEKIIAITTLFKEQLNKVEAGLYRTLLAFI